MQAYDFEKAKHSDVKDAVDLLNKVKNRIPRYFTRSMNMIMERMSRFSKNNEAEEKPKKVKV